MSVELVIVATAIVAASGPVAAIFPHKGRAGDLVFVGLLLLGSLIGISAGVRTLAGVPTQPLVLPWAVPGGAFEADVDALSAVFLVQIFLIGGVAAVYGLGYRPSATAVGGAKLRVFCGLMIAGMALLVVARNAVLFLLGWEVMALSGFMAITTDDHERGVRESGFVYVVATRVGTLLVIAAFAVLRVATGSFSLSGAHVSAATPAGTAIFLLALLGFGLKAGIMPLHLWLPGAHANAPSHVSAVMSGVLIKMGIYGLFRLATWFTEIPLWWGICVLALGAVSSVLGVAFALGQHDLKRLLAYHSVENIGIIVLAYGVALIGRAVGEPLFVVLGMSGAVLHVFNHGLFKALLFLAAGATIHAAHTREIDRLGGLMKRLPLTALAFLVGAVAISGLPPLNGFVSELFVYLAMLNATLQPLGALGFVLALGVPVLALTGALAVACFVKVFGIVYLGEPRTEHGEEAHEAPPSMLIPMGVLAAGCVLIGLLPRFLTPALDRIVAAWVGRPLPLSLGSLVPLESLMTANALLLVGLALLAALVSRAMAGAVRRPTWDCGYSAPTSRMQYTSSSFAAEIVGIFGFALRPHHSAPRLDTPFPGSSHFESHVPEVVLDRIVTPVGHLLARGATRLRFIQHGKVQLYVAYVLFALFALLFIWR